MDELGDAWAQGGLEVLTCAVDSVGELDAVLLAQSPDIAYSPRFRLGPEEGKAFSIPHLLAQRGIGWIGSPDEVLATALSKPRMKSVWRSKGLATPDWFVVVAGRDGGLLGLELLDGARDFPYIVKPASEGNSRGVDASCVASTPLQLYGKVCEVCGRYGEAMVEGFLGGASPAREFTVAMIGTPPHAALGVIELLRDGGGVITQADKDEHRIGVASLEGEPELLDRLTRFAAKAFRAARARDYARLDLILHEDKLYALELNGQPMIPDRWFRTSAQELGLSDPVYLRALAYAGLARMGREGLAFIRPPSALTAGIPPRILDLLGGERRAHGRA